MTQTGGATRSDIAAAKAMQFIQSATNQIEASASGIALQDGMRQWAAYIDMARQRERIAAIVPPNQTRNIGVEALRSRGYRQKTYVTTPSEAVNFLYKGAPKPDTAPTNPILTTVPEQITLNKAQKLKHARSGIARAIAKKREPVLATHDQSIATRDLRQAETKAMMQDERVQQRLAPHKKLMESLQAIATRMARMLSFTDGQIREVRSAVSAERERAKADRAAFVIPKVKQPKRYRAKKLGSEFHPDKQAGSGVAFNAG